jgi:transposase
LDEVDKQRTAALKTMVKLARKNPLYDALRKVDGIGPIFATMFISEVGTPQRFRTRAQLWAYAGLAVTTHESSQFELKDGSIVRRQRSARTRGLVRTYNRTLKYVFKQATMTLTRTKWREQYQALLARSKNPSNAQLTMARKLAAVMLRIAKTGEAYEIAKVFPISPGLASRG